MSLLLLWSGVSVQAPPAPTTGRRRPNWYPGIWGEEVSPAVEWRIRPWREPIEPPAPDEPAPEHEPEPEPVANAPVAQTPVKSEPPKRKQRRKSGRDLGPPVVFAPPAATPVPPLVVPPFVPAKRRIAFAPRVTLETAAVAPIEKRAPVEEEDEDAAVALLLL